MTRRSTRVDAPPPPQGSQPADSAEHPATASRAAAGFWWGGTYTGSPAGSSAQAAPTDNQASQAMQADFTSPISDPHNWVRDPRPPGGFLNYLQNESNFPVPQQLPHHSPMSQHFNFGSGPAPSHLFPFVPPQPSMPKGNPSPSLCKTSKPHRPSGSRSQHVVGVDSGQEEGEMRTGRRLTWKPEEDLRLMSSWLNNSNDSINGNNKKNEQYWNDVAAVYNNTTTKSRWRSAKQAKDRWHTVNKLVYQFQYSWNKAFRIYSSGQSDDQLMEKAHAFYEKDWGGQFLLMNVWKAARDQPKWHNYNKILEEAKKRKVTDVRETGEHTSSAIPNEDQPRPIGTKEAKAQRNGKSKAKEATTEMEELKKYQEIQLEATKNRMGVLEKQGRLSTEKLEAAKLSHLAAQENKEARKHEKEAEMLRTYRVMFSQGTSEMSENIKDEYAKGLKAMRERLFGNSQ